MKKKIILVVSIFIGMLLACNNDDGNENRPEFSISDQLVNVFDNAIISQADVFIEETNTFQILAQDFSEDTSQANFESLQNAWKTLKLEWEPLEALTFGVDIGITGKISNIDFWPIDTESIDTIINQNESEVNLSFLFSSNSRLLGLAAIEYVLFVEEFDAFSEEEFLQNKINFFLAQAEYLVGQAEEYKNEQLANEEAFKEAATKSVTGTQNFLFNEVVFKIDEISNLKIGEALGITSGIPDNTKTEAPYSQLSLAIIEREMQGVESVFTGQFNENSLDDGFYKELESLGRSDLVNLLNNQFDEIYELIRGIDNTLEQQLEQDPSSILPLREAINDLEILIRVDVQSALDIILTFSDNDGD